MQVSRTNGLTFGQIYLGTGNQSLSKTQLDVLDDINLTLENGNYIKRLEKLGYDVYMEPLKNDNFSISVAFFKNARFDKNKNIIFDKVVNIGNFIADVGLKYRNNSNSCSVDRFENSIKNFFKNEAWGKYKRYVNYL